MRRAITIAGSLALLTLVLGAAVFVWPMIAAQSGPDGGMGALVIMIIGCFVVGGALMFLLFYSARRGYDQAVYRGTSSEAEPPERKYGEP